MSTDWSAYFNALPLYGVRGGLKLSPPEIERVNKQFGLPAGFALLYDKDHNASSLNVATLFPLLISAMRGGSSEMQAIKAELASMRADVIAAKADSAIAKSDAASAKLEVASQRLQIEALNNDAAALQDEIDAARAALDVSTADIKENQSNFMTAFSDVFVKEDEVEAEYEEARVVGQLTPLSGSAIEESGDAKPEEVRSRRRVVKA